MALTKNLLILNTSVLSSMGALKASKRNLTFQKILNLIKLSSIPTQLSANLNFGMYVVKH